MKTLTIAILLFSTSAFSWDDGQEALSRSQQQFHQWEMERLANEQRQIQQQQLLEMQRQTEALRDAEFEQWRSNFSESLDRMNDD